MANKRIGVLLWLLCMAQYLLAQERLDTISVLNWPEFRQWVLGAHPVAKQAALLDQYSTAYLMKARGGFDPKSFANYESKNFNGVDYFNHVEGGLKWPTEFGLELKGTYNYASGVYLNDEAKLPSVGQASFGFNWTLGRGLLFDERRADRAQAQILKRMNAAERRNLLNDLMLEATKAYWSWVLAHSQLRLYEEVLLQSRIRLEGIRESFKQGDRAAIDTIESLIQVQTRELDVNFAAVEVKNAALELSRFLWTEDQAALNVDQLPNAPDLFIAALSIPILDRSASNWLQLINSHPALEMYQAKLSQLEVERRLKNENRKPSLDLNYNLLGNGWEFFPANTGNGPEVLINDIKWGIQYSYPILNRKARGDLEITKIKISETNWQFRDKQQQIQVKMNQYLNDLNNLDKQLSLFTGVATNYELLFEGETEKFRQGESSIFLINTREQRWLDARVKTLKLQSELLKTSAALRWAAGKLAE
jgi:outer membrane protein TolC